MKTQPVSFFVVVFDRPERRLVQIKSFADEEEALAHLFATEDKYLRTSPNRYEVVLLGAESLDDLHKTHARYFAKSNDDDDYLVAL